MDHYKTMWDNYLEWQTWHMEYMDDIHVSLDSSLVSINIQHIKLARNFFPVSQCHLNYFISSGIQSLMTCHLRLLWNAQQGACNPSIASTNTTANTTFLLAQVFFCPLGSNLQGVPKRRKPRDPEIYFATWKFPLGHRKHLQQWMMFV